jgi:adenylate cyclase
VAEERVLRRLAAILAADIVGYARLMERDEAGTLARVKALRTELLYPKVDEYGGRIVKTTGDGTLLEFPSAVDAVRHAVDVQGALARRGADEPADRRIALRMGINLGDVIIEGDDIYGDGVNVAARLEGLAEPGGICVSATVHEHVHSKIDLAFDDLGERAVKNIARPVRIYRIRLGAPAPKPASAGEAGREAPAEPTVAVLPFTNMSGDPEQEYFSDGITEDIITDLSKVSGLMVIARNSSFVYKGKAISVKDVGRELGVRYVLEGSVRKAGSRLRITGQLIDCATDRHLWAERYDRNLDDIFAVQEEVARQVVAALEVTLLPREDTRLGRAPAGNVAAYDEFLRGRLAIHPPTRENLAEGRRRFQRAIDLDPDFLGGYAGLSLVESSEILFGMRERTPDTLGRVLDLAEKSVSRDEPLGWPYVALAFARWVNGRHDEAVEAARKAVEIQPGDAETHAWLGFFLTWAGQPLEGIPHIERAMRLSPAYHGPFLNFLGYAHVMAGHHDAAIRAIEGAPPGAYSAGTFCCLILAQFENGEIDKAKDTAKFALARYPEPMSYLGWLSYAPKRPEDRQRFATALGRSGIPVPDRPG